MSHKYRVGTIGKFIDNIWFVLLGGVATKLQAVELVSSYCKFTIKNYDKI